MVRFVDKLGNEFDCDFVFDDSDTLVMSGGALKCIYFLGALSAVMEFPGVGFKNFSATSSGSVVATLLAAGYHPLEIFRELVRRDTGSITTALESTIYGMKEMLEAKGISPDATFSDFWAMGLRLSFVTSNVSKMTEEVFSAEKTPSVSVLDAVRLSCSLPLIFPVSRFKGAIYADGIFFDNFPIKAVKTFPRRGRVVAISTLGSHYDMRLTQYYRRPEIYKILLIDESVSKKYFFVSKEDKFCMFAHGMRFVRDGVARCKKIRRRNSV